MYKLGQQSFIADEYLGINASYGYFKTGQWKFWDFNEEKLTDQKYTRASIYYWQVAQIFKFLPATEANARLVSVVWGIIGIISIFIVSYLITKNYFIALLAALLMSVSISSLMYDRKLRMYSMFVPIFLWFSYALFYFLESKAEKGIKIIKDLSERTGLNWNFFLPVVMLGVVAILTHTLAINIIPATLAYLLLSAIIKYKKEKKIDKKYVLLFSAIVAIGLLSLNLDRVRGGLAFFSWWINNWSYLEKVTLDYSQMLLAGVFFSAGCYYLIKKYSKVGLWTVIFYLVILFLAIMVWKRNAGHQYILLTQSFKIIIMASGIYFIAINLAEKIFSESKKWFVGLILLFLAILLNFSFFFSEEGFYQDPKKWSHSNYREAFGYYLKHRKPNDAIITREFTNYYLRGSQSNVIDYGEDDKLTLSKIVDAQNKFERIWVIYSSGTYTKGEARHHIEDNFKSVETSFTKDRINIWLYDKNSPEQLQ